jgi:hypothetical protein
VILRLEEYIEDDDDDDDDDGDRDVFEIVRRNSNETLSTVSEYKVFIQ